MFVVTFFIVLTEYWQKKQRDEDSTVAHSLGETIQDSRGSVTGTWVLGVAMRKCYIWLNGGSCSASEHVYQKIT